MAWRNKSRWVGIRDHMGFNQEAYDAERAAAAGALEVAGLRRTPPGAVTIFSDAQAAIGRMTTDEPGPGQLYAVSGGKWIAELRKARPGIRIKIRWCPGHGGAACNEKAD